MKYILIYKAENVWATCIKREFETFEEIKQYIDKCGVNINNIVYLGENKPLEYKITLLDRED